MSQINAIDILKDSFSRVSERVDPLLEGLDAGDVTWQPAPDANPIGWLVWHLSRVTDDHLTKLSGAKIEGTAAASAVFDVRPGGTAALPVANATIRGWGEVAGVPKTNFALTVGSAGELELAYAAAEERFAGAEEVPMPERWGGYLLAPERVEFWRGGRDRFHDRVECRRTGEGPGATWEVRRLQP